jgi:hypothetical protein
LWHTPSPQSSIDSIAAVSWQNGSHIRVYHSAGGSVYEDRKDDGNWTHDVAWPAGQVTGDLASAVSWESNALTAISWSNDVVRAITMNAHGVNPGDSFQISGVTPTGYNGTFRALPDTAGDTLFYGLATNPGVATVLGTLVGINIRVHVRNNQGKIDVYASWDGNIYKKTQLP